MLSTSRAEITASSGTLPNSAILRRMSRSSPRSDRQTIACGWIPIRRSSLTECCVGLVFSSPAWPTYGTRVRCTNMQRRGPRSV